MCKCTPTIRTPYCGQGVCQWPDAEGLYTREEVEHREMQAAVKILEFALRVCLAAKNHSNSLVTQAQPGFQLACDFLADAFKKKKEEANKLLSEVDKEAHGDADLKAAVCELAKVLGVSP